MKRIVRKLHKGLYAVTTGPRLRHLARGGETARLLATALEAVAHRRASDEEVAWVAKIEEVRDDLSAATDILRIPDFGARSTTSAPPLVRWTVGDVCRVFTKQPKWSFLLFELVRELRPSLCIELGTSIGISTAYQAAALELNGGGRIVTIEGAREQAHLAERNLARLGLTNVRVIIGLFEDVLDDVLRVNPGFSFAFIDGHHDERATLDYFQRMLPHAAPHAVFVFDDIDWSAGMKRAWSAISRDPRVCIAIDLFDIGLCVVDGTSGKTRRSKLALAWGDSKLV